MNKYNIPETDSIGELARFWDTRDEGQAQP